MSVLGNGWMSHNGVFENGEDGLNEIVAKGDSGRFLRQALRQMLNASRDHVINLAVK